MSDSTARPVRFVLFYRSGPKWIAGIDFRQKEDVGVHVGHYLKLYEQGKLELGGPFLLQDAGGMMGATKEVTQEELMPLQAMTLLSNRACWFTISVPG